MRRVWNRVSIVCAALALTWALFMLDGPGLVSGRARTCIGTVSGPDMNGPSEYRGVITYAERTNVYENMQVIATVWTVSTPGIVGTLALTTAVWAVAGRLALRRRCDGLRGS
jgi:hypothetical protein